MSYRTLEDYFESLTANLIRDLKPYHQFNIIADEASFVEVSINLACATYKGEMITINLIRKPKSGYNLWEWVRGDGVVSINEYCGYSYSEFPILPENSLMTEDISRQFFHCNTRNNDGSVNILLKEQFKEKAIIETFGRWFSKVWSMEKESKISIPVFASNEDPYEWFDIEKLEWIKEPFN